MKVRDIYLNKLFSPSSKHATGPILVPWAFWLLRRSRLKIFKTFDPMTLNEGKGYSFEQTWQCFISACFRPNISSLGLLVIVKKSFEDF